MSFEIRRLGFGQIIDTSIRLVRAEFLLLVSISAIWCVPLAIVARQVQSTILSGQSDSAAVLGAAGSYLLVYLVLMLLIPLIQCAILGAAADAYRGRVSTFGGALQSACALYLPFLGTLMLYGLAIGALVGISAFLTAVLREIPLVAVLVLLAGTLATAYLVVAWMLVGPVILVERVYGTTPLSRSASLVKGFWWRTFGLYVTAALLYGVVTASASAIFTFLPYVGAVFGGIVDAISFAFLSCLLVVIYFDLRCRKEDYDLELLAEQVQSPGAEPAR